MTIADSLLQLSNTKTDIKDAIEAQGVTVGAIAFDQYASKIALIEGGGGPSGPEPWVRPTDWLTLPTVGASEQKIVGLHAVFPGTNFVALQCQGAYTVDWGDGVTENFSSNVKANHTYDYTNSLFDGTLTEQGFKQVIVTVTPQAGQNLTNAVFSVKNDQAGLANSYSQCWKELVFGLPLGAQLEVGNSNNNARNINLERVRVESIKATSFSGMFSNCASLQEVSFNTLVVLPTNLTSMFSGCNSLRTVTLFDTSSATSTANMFYGCQSLETVPLFNTANVTDMSAMFAGCSKLPTVPLFNTSKATSMNTMFSACYSLEEVPHFNTEKVVDMNSMFANCWRLETVPLFNTSLVTTFTNMFSTCTALKEVPFFDTSKATAMGSMFYYCIRLTRVPTFVTTLATNTAGIFRLCFSLVEVPAMNFSPTTSYTNTFTSCFSLRSIKLTGINQTFTIANCQLSATELNALYTNLATVSGKTITVTGNYGTATDDPTIATSKGWTVTG